MIALIGSDGERRNSLSSSGKVKRSSELWETSRKINMYRPQPDNLINRHKAEEYARTRNRIQNYLWSKFEPGVHLAQTIRSCSLYEQVKHLEETLIFIRQSWQPWAFLALVLLTFGANLYGWQCLALELRKGGYCVAGGPALGLGFTGTLLSLLFFFPVVNTCFFLRREIKRRLGQLQAQTKK